MLQTETGTRSNCRMAEASNKSYAHPYCVVLFRLIRSTDLAILQCSLTGIGFDIVLRDSVG